jgi:chemotaxis protein MotB
MRESRKKLLLSVFGVAVLVVLSGCTNWEKRYKTLNVEHENLKGLYDNCVASLDGCTADKSQCESELSSCQQRLNEIQSEMAQGQSAADATGFKGMDVAVDPTAGTITVTLPNAILFSPGKASLKKSTISELNQILTVLRQRYWGRRVDVVGHTDSDPIRKSNWKDNWELSAQRSLSVLRYLVDRGFSPSDIRACGAGEHNPIASNASSSGKAKNRRVEVVVYMR